MVDRYTKIVLTVIAGCLLWICVMGLPRPVMAQETTIPLSSFSASIQPVVIVGTGSMDRTGKVDVNFRGAAGRTDPTLPVQLPYSAAKPLAVSLPYSQGSPMPARLFYSADAPMPVQITAVKKTGDWEPLRASVEDAPARKRPGGQ